MKDGLLYRNARGFQIIYNAVVVLLLWITQSWRSGHWYFDAETLTTPRKTKGE